MIVSKLCSVVNGVKPQRQAMSISSSDEVVSSQGVLLDASFHTQSTSLAFAAFMPISTP